MINKDISKKIFWYSVISLVVLRIIVSLFLLNGFFSIKPDERMSFGRTGDENAYFEVSKSILRFETPEKPIHATIGAPLYQAIFIKALNAETKDDINIFINFLQILVYYSISIALVIFIGRYIFKNRLLGLLSGILYVLYPILIYLLNIGPYLDNSDNFIDAIWLRGLMTDGLSAFLVYIGLYFFVKDFYGKEKLNKLVVLSGLFIGLASLVRVTNGIFGIAFIISLLLLKKIRKSIYFVIASGVIFLPQLIYNHLAHGWFLSFGSFGARMNNGMLKSDYYLYEMGAICKLGFNTDNYYYALSVFDRYIPYLSFFLVVVISLFVLTYRYIYQVNKKFFPVIFLTTIPFIVFYLSFHPAIRNIRYWLPIIPVMIVVFIYSLFMMKYFTKQFIFYVRKQKNSNSNTSL